MHVDINKCKISLSSKLQFCTLYYMYCKSWTVKKAERQRIDAFELWCWRRLLRVTWTARMSNQSILKEISPGCSLEGMMLKLKLQYFGHPMRRVDSLEKTLMLGGVGGRGEDLESLRLHQEWDGRMENMLECAFIVLWLHLGCKLQVKRWDPMGTFSQRLGGERGV